MLAGLAGVGRAETGAFSWGDAESGVQRIETVMGSVRRESHQSQDFPGASRQGCGVVRGRSRA